MVDNFDTFVLNRVVDNLVDDTQFLSNTFFPEVSTSEEETIMFDVTNERQLVTPFVSPLVEGRLVADKGYSTKSFRPAYAKDKRIFDPNKAFRRMPGETIGGNLTPAQRHQAQVAFALNEQISMLNRRFEVMAADVLVNGTATIAGEGYPQVVVDFGRRSGNRKVLTSTATWTVANVVAGNATPIQNLEDWAQEVSDATGFAPTIAIMTTDAWKALKADPGFEKLVDTRRREMNGASIATGPMVQPRAGVLYRGYVGQIELWTYSGVYTDPEDNTSKPILPANTVLLGSPAGVDGVRHFGAIRDLDAGIQARQYFVKSWTVPDPSRRFLLMQSAPLLVPYRPNNLLSAKVA